LSWSGVSPSLTHGRGGRGVRVAPTWLKHTQIVAVGRRASVLIAWRLLEQASRAQLRVHGGAVIIARAPDVGPDLDGCAFG